jgi:hypothetical protein
MALMIDPIVRSLAQRGWTRADFSANHLEHVALTCLGGLQGTLRSPFEPYWRTVASISSILQRERLFHVIIKTRRCYPYSDTNVDVFVRDADAKRVQQLLCAASWRMPARSVILKQRLIEREKLKLPPREPGFVPAHLYMSVCWRYQRDVSFLDEGMIEMMPLESEAPGLAAEFGGLAIPVPTRTADILLHCAEIVFENYRVALGEALYVAWLLEHVSAQDQARIHEMARDRGAAAAVHCIEARARAVLDSAGGVAADWPRNLTARELLASWGGRLAWQAGRRRPLAGLEEWFGYAAFGSMYGIKRAWFD